MKKIILVSTIFIAQFAFSQTVKSLKIESGEKKEQLTDLTKEKIASYNEKFLQFINTLKISDRKASDALLSEKAKMVVSDNVYKRLSTDIDFSKKLEIYKSGYKMVKDGNMYPMIQYKYADDKSINPQHIITAVFEENGKILGIKPVKNTLNK
ncbi:peptidylprolyl isomerase [Chryseobacterium oryctis]|uniref:Peptidylprolyl isomerase n=1 Tax=Chryseobacterium oryctis TaxID=2952618 RepID=A0ABT3HR83_9FLAO|nr:peptidylprolyl isomerase [Chryseobacterium oryctis]MCW3162190.1 peptidylprolyl isomerase [Chryseobacterium oryctis]